MLDRCKTAFAFTLVALSQLDLVWESSELVILDNHTMDTKIFPVGFEIDRHSRTLEAAVDWIVATYGDELKWE